MNEKCDACVSVVFDFVDAVLKKMFMKMILLVFKAGVLDGDDESLLQVGDFFCCMSSEAIDVAVNECGF